MTYELAQMSRLLDPLLDQVGEDELMRLWQEMAMKKGIVWGLDPRGGEG